QLNSARTFQVDYGYDDHEIAQFVINYLETGTAVSFQTENFIEASGSSFKVVNASGQDMGCAFTGQEGAIRHYSCNNLPNGTYRIVAIKENGHGGEGQTYPLTLREYYSVTRKAPGTLMNIGGLRVRKITDTDPLTGNKQIKEFEYSGG